PDHRHRVGFEPEVLGEAKHLVAPRRSAEHLRRSDGDKRRHLPPPGPVHENSLLLIQTATGPPAHHPTGMNARPPGSSVVDDVRCPEAGDRRGPNHTRGRRFMTETRSTGSTPTAYRDADAPTGWVGWIL